MEDILLDQVLKQVQNREISIDKARELICVLFNVGNSEANVCPKCGYPKFKKHHEDFERCNGCDWKSK